MNDLIKLDIVSKSEFSEYILKFGCQPVDYDTLPARPRILIASLKLFVDQGYFNTNIPDISRESKCSVGSIYHHFKSKEDIASALYSAALDCLRLSLYEQIEVETDTQIVIQKLIEAFLDFSQKHKRLSKYLWLNRHHEFLSGKIQHPTRVGFDNLGRKLTTVIKTGIRNGEIINMEANILWSILFGTPISYVRDWLDGFNSTPPSEVKNTISRACLKAISTAN